MSLGRTPGPPDRVLDSLTGAPNLLRGALDRWDTAPTSENGATDRSGRPPTGRPSATPSPGASPRHRDGARTRRSQASPLWGRARSLRDRTFNARTRPSTPGCRAPSRGERAPSARRQPHPVVNGARRPLRHVRGHIAGRPNRWADSRPSRCEPPGVCGGIRDLAMGGLRFYCRWFRLCSGPPTLVIHRSVPPLDGAKCLTFQNSSPPHERVREPPTKEAGAHATQRILSQQ